MLHIISNTHHPFIHNKLTESTLTKNDIIGLNIKKRICEIIF